MINSDKSQCHICGYHRSAVEESRCSECGEMPDHRWKSERAAVVAKRHPFLYTILYNTVHMRNVVCYLAAIFYIVLPAIKLSAIPLAVWLPVLCFVSVIHACSIAAPIALFKSQFADEFSAQLAVGVLRTVIFPILLSVFLLAAGPIHYFAVVGVCVFCCIASSVHHSSIYKSVAFHADLHQKLFIESTEKSIFVLMQFALFFIIIFVMPPVSIGVYEQLVAALFILMIMDICNRRLVQYFKQNILIRDS